MSCGVGRRCGSDPGLLWLWHRPAAVALIQPLAWEPPYAAGVAQKRQKKKKPKPTPPPKKNTCYKHLYASFCVDIKFQLLRVNTKVCHRWIVW